MSAVEAYLTAKANFDRVRGEVSELAEFIKAVGSALSQDPGRMIFANVAQGLPMEASMSAGSKSFNADQWKSADQIQSLLARWHDAKQAVSVAWGAVPAEMKANLSPPDQGPGGGYPRVNRGIGILRS